MSSFGYEQVKPHTPPVTGGYTRVRPPSRRAPKIPKAPTRPVRRQVVDPFAPETDAQSQARARQLVQAQLGPILQEIQQAIEARSRSGEAAITGYTGQLGHLMQGVPEQTGQYYQQAKQSQSGINDALANRLGSFGQGLGQEIQGKIGYAPAAVQQQVAGGAQQTAQGVANANFAKGSAGVEALNAQGAAAQGYGAALPGIAGLTGLQSSKQLQLQLNSELAKELSGARSQAESSYSSIYEGERNRELQKAIAKQSGLVNQDKLQADKQYRNAQLTYKQQKDRYDRAIKLQQLGVTQQRVNEYARHNGVTEAEAQTRLIQQGRRDKAQRAQAATRNRIAQQNANTAAKRAAKSGKKGGVPKGLGGG